MREYVFVAVVLLLVRPVAVFLALIRVDLPFSEKLHLARENSELADKSFRASLAENPDHIGSLTELGTLYTKRGTTNRLNTLSQT